MKFKIHWDDGEYTGSIAINANIENIEEIARREIDRLGWEAEDCRIEEIK